MQSPLLLCIDAHIKMYCMLISAHLLYAFPLTATSSGGCMSVLDFQILLSQKLYTTQRQERYSRVSYEHKDISYYKPHILHLHRFDLNSALNLQ